MLIGFSLDFLSLAFHDTPISYFFLCLLLTHTHTHLSILHNIMILGMITSVGASIPLFFCQLQFFAKFGTFLCLVIAFRYVFLLVISNGNMCNPRTHLCLFHYLQLGVCELCVHESLGSVEDPIERKGMPFLEVIQFWMFLSLE